MDTVPFAEDSVSLPNLAEELLAEARAAHSGRASRTIRGGRTHALRETLMALTEDNGLQAHDGPTEATLQVLAGRVRLNVGDDSWTGSTGDFVSIPPLRHSVDALEDSVILLTVYNGEPVHSIGTRP